MQHINKTLKRIIVSAGFGAVTGLFVAIWMDQGKLTILSWDVLIPGWGVISLIFSVAWVIIFWLIPSIISLFLNKTYE